VLKIPPFAKPQNVGCNNKEENMTVLDLKKYKDSLYTSLSRDLSEFEKNFLLISGGILTFSISFIKEIVKIDQALYLPMLYISWGFIIISIALMMYTFLKSSIASDELWTTVDDFIISNRLYKDEVELTDDQVDRIKNAVNSSFYSIKKTLRILRYFSVASFIVGIIFLAIYVSINLTNENRNLSTNKTNIENPNVIDSVLIYHNNKSIIINLNYGKEGRICSSKTDTKQTDNSTETITKAAGTTTNPSTRSSPERKTASTKPSSDTKTR
jgi:hypothetical protein